jgi:acyl-CoA dehydrogenase
VVHLIVEVDGDPAFARINPDTAQIELAENLAGEPRDTLLFDGLHVGSSDWLAAGDLIAALVLRGALMRTIAMAGAMTSLFDMTTTYTQDRVQFGRPISKFQAVQQLLARLAGEVQVSVSAARAAVVAVQSGTAELEIAAAAVRVSEAAEVASRIAHQLHGAIGVTREYPLHVFTTRLRSWSNEFGNRAAWSKMIARQMLGATEPSVWSLLTDERVKSQ